jgi:hypothetical protein
MSAQPSDQHWFISLNGKRYGPYSFTALSEAVAKGVIDGNTSVWRLGWVKWHPARRVPGLIEESPPPESLDQASDQKSQEGDDRASAETDRPWQDEDIGAEVPRRPARPIVEDEQVTTEGQRQRRVEDDLAEAPRRRKSQATEDENVGAEAPRRRKQAVEDQVVANEVPRRRKSQAAEEENAPVGGALRARPPSEDNEGDDNVAAPPIGDRRPNGAGRRTEEGAVPHVEVRDRLALSPPRQAGGFAKSAAVGVLVVTVLAGAGLFYSGMIVMVEPRRTTASVEQPPPVAPQPPQPQPPVALAPPPPERAVSGNLAADGGGLPDVVAALPAVLALQRNDPAAFARFSKRFAASAANAADDALPSLARTALRKTVKRQLANSPADALLEITEVYLAYMQALQTLSPESCVALSDESKGANLTVNLAQQLPALFGREMAVLERVASADSATVAAATADKAKPYLDKVYTQLLKQPVQIELLGRGTLVESEFMPYCALVIAFYKTVLTLPPDDRVNLLRYLYTAAIDPDDDVAK